jgi:hypothetical protein
LKEYLQKFGYMAPYDANGGKDDVMSGIGTHNVKKGMV